MRGERLKTLQYSFLGQEPGLLTCGDRLSSQQGLLLGSPASLGFAASANWRVDPAELGTHEQTLRQQIHLASALGANPSLQATAHASPGQLSAEPSAAQLAQAINS
mmetsp:Transcript_11492/g.34517  ORF Transcript_11492/g.34517 Transcript_11492/m.34517 type:complete len:106 (-) Transcript_11492:153-470(-)